MQIQKYKNRYLYVTRTNKSIIYIVTLVAVVVKIDEI